MKLITAVSIFLILQTAFLSCADKTQEEKKIRDLLAQETKAHFDRDTELFIAEFSDSMISVNRGVVSRSKKEEHRKRIGEYFGKVSFIKWDDVADPIIRISDDGSMAWAIIQKKVILTYNDSTGVVTDTTDYAWVSIYQKENNEWKVAANVSTNK